MRGSLCRCVVKKRGAKVEAVGHYREEWPVNHLLLPNFFHICGDMLPFLTSSALAREGIVRGLGGR